MKPSFRVLRPFGALALACTAAVELAAQDCPFSLGPDTTVCHGANLLLQAPVGVLELHWQNGFQSQTITADTTGLYWCTATFLQPGANMVSNGDFSGGDSAFTTDFTLGTGGTWGQLSTEGTYAITTDPSLVHTNFSACGDHTGGGQMLVVNGSPLPNANIWCQTVQVTPNTYYAFSAWLMSCTPQNPAMMDFQVDGVSLGTPLLASSTTCAWDEFYAIWNSGNATSATICIINQQLAADGNDFALDDISFTPLCTFTDSIHVTVLPPAPGLDAGPGGALCPEDSATVMATLVPASWPLDDVVYTWSTGADSPSITVHDPGTYTVTATGLCLDAQATVVFLPDTCTLPPTELWMPNVFTPNGDGSNDQFGPVVNGPPDGFRMEVRNRWGQRVFSTDRVERRWDGRANNGVVPDGTYYWVVHYGNRHADGQVTQETLTGSVTLLGGR
ncbi:MAG: gliding motility-associated C-terminal domain-containing protein [Flavobacteriales bacterium]|nr:gliding motility-associated C-terminal domain-containing protein [Flavobacteriales bacterium]